MYINNGAIIFSIKTKQLHAIEIKTIAAITDCFAVCPCNNLSVLFVCYILYSCHGPQLLAS